MPLDGEIGTVLSAESRTLVVPAAAARSLRSS
jgi:hypothetical protein